MNLTPEQTTLIGTLAGAIIGFLSSFIITWVTKKSEKRKHFRELVIKAATESWSQTLQSLKGQNATVDPFDLYIIHLLKLSQVVLDEKITPDNVVEMLKRVDAVTAKAREYRYEKYELEVKKASQRSVKKL